MLPDSDESQIRSPQEVRERVIALNANRATHIRDKRRRRRRLSELEDYLSTASDVENALESLSNALLRQLVSIIEEELTKALQEILEQPIGLKAHVTWKRSTLHVEFSIDRDGNREHILKSQGGSVVNIVSVGLRLFALTQLDSERHRRFLVLDEQDCWIRPDLVPRLVKIIREAGDALGVQVLMISHHELSVFAQYADKVCELVPDPDDGVTVRQRLTEPTYRDASPDGD